jgi:YYY domain-containing protein
MFGQRSVPTRFPLPFWVLALVLAGVIGLPYVWLAAAALPDRGFALARPVGLLLVAWLAWWLGSLRLLAFTRASTAAAAALATAGGVAIVLRRRREFVAWLRASRRLLLAEETLFWLLFAGAVLIRWANPDLWHPARGGEKPMDLAFLNAVVKSSYFPPYDPWFAGGTLNYYYFGFVVVGVVAKATSIAPYVAYNLAVPTLLACTGAAAFTATLALVAPARAAARRLPLATAALGAAFVALAGNLEEIKLVVRSIHRTIPNDWWFWNASRAIHHPPGETGAITEFPFFTYLFADLHAHAMALPFTLVALALGVACVRAGAAAVGRGGSALRLGLLALVTGALSVTNTWDLPTYALLAGLFLAAERWARDRRWTGRGVAALAGTWAAVVAAAYVVFLPYHVRYESAFSGVQRWRGSRTPIGDYLTIHGFFLFVIAVGLIVELARARDANAVARLLRLALRRPRRLARLRRLHRTLVRPSGRYAAGIAFLLTAAAFAVALASLGQGVAAVAAALAALAVLALVRRRRGGLERVLQQTAIVLVLVGLALTVAVEYLVVKNIDVGRQNTVFKFYLQVWVLWAIAAAVFVHVTYARLPSFRRPWRVAWRASFVVLLALVSLYPILATRARVRDRFDPSAGRTLDGMAFMARAVHSDHGSTFPLRDDEQAIRWMLASLPGSPVIGELNTSPTLYGWGNRYAMFTGNPAVVGWDYHERQQRPAENTLVTERIAQIQTAYRTRRPEVAHRIFRRYGVRYFVVGPLERAYFPSGQAKWASRAGNLWRLVYRNPGVRVYELLPTAR